MIIIKNPKEIKIMTEGGKILAKIMAELEKLIKPGITTNELNKVVEDLVLRSGAKCSFKDYAPEGEAIAFPSCLCTSLNEQIVHSAPSERRLLEGDIISLDLGIFYQGFHTDMAITLPVGKVAPEVLRLIQVTKEALKRGIEKVRPGITFGDIGETIQSYVESERFNVVRDLCGHGIGKELHEDPQILNYGKRRTGEEIKEGMVFCLEPMVTIADWRIKRMKNGYGFETADGSLSAHFEHTVVVTRDGCRVLTELTC